MKNQRIFPALPVLALLLFTAPVDLLAQTLDTVWQVEYQRRMDSYDGSKQYPLDTMTIWFNEELARQVTAKDRYVVVREDSIIIIDTFHHEASTVELAWMNQIWKKDLPLVWRRRRMQPIRVQRYGEEETIANYPTEKFHFDFVTNREMAFPMRMYVWASDELPMTRKELENLYTIRTLIDNSLAVQHEDINDTLLSWGMLPFRTQIRSNTGQLDTSGVQVLELLSVKRVTMPSSHFLPPPEWPNASVPSPTDEQLWDISGIPLPGGPKNDE